MTSPTDQAGTITAGTPLPLTFAAGNAGQNATETFSGTAGQKVSLNLTANTIGANTISGTKVSIVTGSTTVVAATDVGTNGKFIEPVTLPSTATYTIKVDPQGANTGGITLGLANFGSDTTGTITANGSATVVTSTAAGQNGTLTFTGSVNQRIALNLSSQLRDDVLGRAGVGEVAHEHDRRRPRRRRDERRVRRAGHTDGRGHVHGQGRP